MVLTTCQYTYVKLGNLGINKADDSYTTEHIKNWSSSYNIYNIYIFTILKINLLKKSVIKYDVFDYN